MPPKKAESVAKTPLVEPVRVFEILRKRSADENDAAKELLSSPPVTLERSRLESVAGRVVKKAAASLRRGGTKKNRSTKNPAATEAYKMTTETKRCMPLRDKKSIAGSIAEAMTTAVSTMSTRSRR